MKRLLQTALITAFAVILTAGCSKEDDIDEIFIGNTWYVRSAMLNGTSLSQKEMNSLYDSDDSYWIYFDQTTFSGKMDAPSSYSGTWSVDAKNGDISFHITSEVNMNANTTSRTIYTIIKNASYYKGDSNVLRIYMDKDSYVSFARSKKGL